MALEGENQYSRVKFNFDAQGKLNIFKLDVDITKLVSVGAVEVSDFEIGKPWIVANRVYGQPYLWWFLMKYNAIKRFDTEMFAGQVLNYPSISEYYELLERYAEA